MIKRNTFFADFKLLLFSHGSSFMFVVLLFLITLLMTLTPYGIYFWMILGGMLLFVISWFRYLDVSAIFVGLFGFFYGIFSVMFNVSYSGSSFLSYFMVPLPLYCLGRWFFSCLKRQDSQIEILIFLSLACISFVLLYRTVMDVAQGEIVSINRTFEIEGVETISSTLYGMYAAVTMVGLPVFFTSLQKRTLQSWLFLLLALLGILTTIHLVNRTGLVIAVVVTLVGCIYRSRANMGRFFLLVGIIVTIIYVLIEMKVIPQEAIEAYEVRNEVSEQSGTSLAGGRGHRWLDAIGRVFYMPFGWYRQEYITGYGYVHNWWLDVGRLVGLIPFLLLLVPTIISIKNCFKLFRKRNNKIHLLLISLNIVLFLATFVEPVMEGSVMIAYYYIFVWGLTSQQVKMMNNRE